MDKHELEVWLKAELSGTLGFEVPDELVGAVLSKTDAEAESYLRELLDPNDPQTGHLVKEFLKRRNRNVTSQLCLTAGPSTSNGLSRDSNTVESSKTSKTVSAQSKVKKKKPKYRNLFSLENGKRTVLLKGRYRCDCEAREHKLINNCLNCGRIVCEQEGSGPCVFCNSIVCSNDEQIVLSKENEQSSQLHEKLVMRNRVRGLEEAIRERNKLLHYDQTCAERTKVIDEDWDYFNYCDVWLSPKEREKLKQKEQEEMEKKNRSKYRKNITIDFKGLKVTEDGKLMYVPNSSNCRASSSSDSSDTEITASELRTISKKFSFNSEIGLPKGQETSDKSNLSRLEKQYSTEKCTQLAEEKRRNFINDGVYDLLKMNVPPKSVHFEVDKKMMKEEIDKALKSHSLRNYASVQPLQPLPLGSTSRVTTIDDEQDQGMCLSMKQPYASLTISDIKRHEGRHWYTDYTGILWIASGKEPAKREEIQSMQDFYRIHLNDENLEFPTDYPCGMILGCVYLVDCLPQEEYREDFPEGEIEDAFVLVFSNPCQLTVPLPVVGKPKIFQLDKDLHNLVKRQLNKIRTAPKKFTELRCGVYNSRLE